MKKFKNNEIKNGKPLVTIVVVQRERFSITPRALEMIYRNTKIPFELVYVDCGSPGKYKKYLEQQAKEKGFILIRMDHYCVPNVARNKGIRRVRTKYVVLIDNDNVVATHWLKPLVDCAQETGADMVGPLACQIKIKNVTGISYGKVVHCAGGDCGITTHTINGRRERHIFKKIYRANQKAAGLRYQLKREETGIVEFHCAMVRMDVFKKCGLLDEQMFMEEHVDFCIRVKQAGGKIYFEPNSIVTYIPGPLRELSDILFYMVRWSNKWEISTYRHMKEKWNLSECKYFSERWPKIGWRRREKIVKLLSHRYFPARTYPIVEKILAGIDWIINPGISSFYDWRYGKGVKTADSIATEVAT